jgi:ribosome maturation factor RimP
LSTASSNTGSVKKKKPLYWGFFVLGETTPVASKEQQLTDMLEPTVEALGFELWGVEYLSQGRHSVLRIYIEGENGITVDDCAAVSEQVGSVLDVEDPITGEYTLEVSSPGMDRLLFKLDQYPGYVGEMVELRLRSAFEGRRRYKGVLQGIEGDDVVLRVDNHEYLLPHGAIEKARIQPRV